jgi:hypothetical protein
MDSPKKIGDIALGQQNCIVVGRLTRLWESKNMRSRFTDLLISMDGVIIDEDVRNLLPQLCKCYLTSTSRILIFLFHSTTWIYGTNYDTKKNLKSSSGFNLQGGGFCMSVTNLNDIAIKQRTYTYHHQKFMLQFQESSKVQRLNSKGENIPNFSFKFCPFDKMPSKDVPSKLLIGTTP